MAKQDKRGGEQKNGDGRNGTKENYQGSQEDSFDGSFNSTEKDSYSRGSTEYEKHR